MKAPKFTAAQKAFSPKQGEQGTPVAQICRKAGILSGDLRPLKNRGADCCRTRADG